MKISIIGAGIGGLTTALALQQSGKQVTVYEKTPQLKPAGAGIAMAGNAMQVFEKLGIRQNIEDVGHLISDFYITDFALNTLSHTNIIPLEQKYGVRNIAIHRADLQKILAEAVGYENIQFGKRLSAIEEKHGYQLTFDDGFSAQCEVLLGADGIGSFVRKTMFAPSHIRDAQQKCWRGVCDVIMPEKYHHRAYELWGKGKRFGFVNIGQGKTYWYAVMNTHLVKDNTNLLQAYADLPQDMLYLINATPKERIILNDIIDLLPINKWSKDKIALVGDAAHATTPNMGQGACQAVEDAFVLGKLFQKNDDVEAIFSQYEQLRRAKVANIVKTSWHIGKISQWENPIAVWSRNLLFKTLPNTLSLKQLEQVVSLDYIGKI